MKVSSENVRLGVGRRIDRQTIIGAKDGSGAKNGSISFAFVLSRELLIVACTINAVSCSSVIDCAAEDAKDTKPVTAVKSTKNVAEKVYSPDRKYYAFIETSKQMVAAGNGDVPADVIWFGSGANSPHPLFKRASTYKTGKPIGDISLGGIGDLCFSADNSELYFINAAYAVSGIVLALNLKTNKIRDVIDANSLEIMRKGQWKGNLLVQRHKYDDQGAYNVQCIVTPQGKELKELKRVEY